MIDTFYPIKKRWRPGTPTFIFVYIGPPLPLLNLHLSPKLAEPSSSTIFSSICKYVVRLLLSVVRLLFISLFCCNFSFSYVV
ncbi:hypothetical protein RchiOBHm_Chr5g0004001 [Rosa chinensis]|uniref:Uncharacterized protein n=1 Tax=Rosa chinensis TaxID=74649 RepID=A0A2P6Q2W5_ROSCH|nr:hypothetical protein RchiOBHm_Chr5g0004001 [Rosa chinensis]